MIMLLTYLPLNYQKLTWFRHNYKYLNQSMCVSLAKIRKWFDQFDIFLFWSPKYRRDIDLIGNRMGETAERS